jgi:hypothetical protein
MADPLPVVVELWVDDEWTDITEHAYTRDPITITRGRSAEGSRVEPSTCTVTLNNQDGTYSPRNPASPYFGKIGRNTPIRVRLSADVRFVGEVAAWPQRWNVPGTDVWAQVDAAGITRRLGQGLSPLRSSMRRFVEAAAPVGYWPLDGGQLSKAGLAVAGAAPATLIPEAARPRRPGFGMEVATVATRQSTSSTSYTDLATDGPEVTVVIGVSGRALVLLAAQVELATGNIQGASMSYDVSGASSVSADGARALFLRDTPSSIVTASHATLHEGLTPGENTFTAKYRKTTANDDPFFAERTIVVIPF